MVCLGVPRLFSSCSVFDNCPNAYCAWSWMKLSLRLIMGQVDNFATFRLLSKFKSSAMAMKAAMKATKAMKAMKKAMKKAADADAAPKKAMKAMKAMKATKKAMKAKK